MAVTINDRFQGMCLMDEVGADTIDYYDGLDPAYRALVQNARFNICPACFGAELSDRGVDWRGSGPTDHDLYIAHTILDEFEAMIASEIDEKQKDWPTR